MKKILLTGACALAGLAAVSAHNRHSGMKHDMNNPHFSVADSIAMYDAFLSVSPEELGDNAVPRFSIVGKNRKFALGVTGLVKAVAVYDFGNPISNPNEFITEAIPMSVPKGDHGKFNFTAQSSQLMLSAIALPGEKHQVGAVIGANLMGNNYLPSLVYAYITYRHFQAGYNYTLFADMSACPSTIDYEGPNAYVSIPTVGIRYVNTFGRNKEWKYGVAAELPQTSYTNSGFTRTVNARVPDIPAFIRYSFGSDGWLRLAGVLRNMQYRDVKKDCNRNAVGYGFSLSGGANLGTPKLQLTGQIAGGQGMTSYFQDLGGCNLDLVPDTKHEGKLSTVGSWGGFLGLTWNFLPKWEATAAYSHLRLYAKGEAPDQYKWAQYVTGNVFYHITPMLQWGVEYIYGRRMNVNGMQAHDNRIQTALQFNF